MTIICLILFLCAAAFWFLANEYPVLFGIFVPACAVRRLTFKVMVSVALVIAIFLGVFSDTFTGISSRYDKDVLDCKSFVIIVLSSLIILSLLKVLQMKGSAIYAFVGAFEAFRIASGNGADAHWVLSFLVAPLMAFAISLVLSLITRNTLAKSHIHLISLSFHLRHVVIACLILTALALGFNWGGFLVAGATLAMSASCPSLIVAAVTAVAILIMSPFMRNMSDENAGEYSDFTIYTVLSVGFATALVLVFFSFDSAAGIIGLDAVPLSVGSLVYAGIAGAEIAGRHRLVESENHLKEVSAMILSPAGSMLLTYLILYLTGRSEDSLVDFTVLSASVIILAAMVFAGYARRQRSQKEATDRLVYSQQQQIYENSRALNDMQLKVVISENQALHNAVEMKRQEVMNVALSIMEQKEYLESLNDIVKQLVKASDEEERTELISQLGSSLKQRLSYDRDVDTAYFYAQAESLHEDFNAKLSENFPDLTQQEKRLATLLRLGFSSKYIATLMNITVKSVEISRYRLRQKLGLSKGDNLVNFIKSI